MDRGGAGPGADFCTCRKAFFFRLELPGGNYYIKLLLGDANGDSRTTVRAVSRRLLFRQIDTRAGELLEVDCTVNIRYPEINGNECILLNDREKQYRNWDHGLTLEFSGERASSILSRIRRTYAGSQPESENQ